jgi:hypothetical protein
MPNEIRDGLANVAHAIRRSTALYVAAITTPADSTPHDVLANAALYAQWLRGSAEDRPARPLGLSLDEARGYEEPPS